MAGDGPDRTVQSPAAIEMWEELATGNIRSGNKAQLDIMRRTQPPVDPNKYYSPIILDSETHSDTSDDRRARKAREGIVENEDKRRERKVRETRERRERNVEWTERREARKNDTYFNKMCIRSAELVNSLNEAIAAGRRPPLQEEPRNGERFRPELRRLLREICHREHSPEGRSGE